MISRKMSDGARAADAEKFLPHVPTSGLYQKSYGLLPLIARMAIRGAEKLTASRDRKFPIRNRCFAHLKDGQLIGWRHHRPPTPSDAVCRNRCGSCRNAVPAGFGVNSSGGASTRAPCVFWVHMSELDEKGPVSPAYRGRDERILVVEDESIVRDTVSRMLIRLGYHVTCCASSEEALVLARNNRYDLILTDLDLPRLSGRDLVQLLAARTAGAQLIMTGHHAAADELPGPVIKKPFDLKTLAVAVRSCLCPSSDSESPPAVNVH